jgi:beta-lactamase superfamily II metal-dependent hydrolase
MEIRIFDVSHGFCAMIATENGGLALIDCGHDSGGFRPTNYLRSIGRNQVHHLIISNYDQDHVSDLHNLIQYANIHVFHRNGSVSPDYIRHLKLQNGPLTDAMKAALYCASTFSHPVLYQPDMGGLEIRTFCNLYPHFTDTNNLSLVAFVRFENFVAVFPGDIEEAGWLSLLQNPDFRVWLSRVNVFVASHHGRRSGYCSDVFIHCRPDVVVISDKEIVHSTQEHNLYAQHATGLLWPGNVRRQVLTTRSDGTIRFLKPSGSNYSVYLDQ